MNNQEIIEYVKKQTNTTLPDLTGSCGFPCDFLYTYISRTDFNKVCSCLTKKGFRVEKHLNDKYFVIGE